MSLLYLISKKQNYSWYRFATITSIFRMVVNRFFAECLSVQCVNSLYDMDKIMANSFYGAAGVKVVDPTKVFVLKTDET